ncbi:MAG TPA: DUF4124 domain-containing protein [Gammaproteobacteria bacterium]|nr:DUF4124 domain-containing protein [Gammaproteobacteria bacterium]
MRSPLYVFGAAMLLGAVNAQAEFYVWRDAHGVKQISNVPPRCFRGQTIAPHCSSISQPLADPEQVAALNQNQLRHDLVRRDADHARSVQEAREAAAEEARARLMTQQAEVDRQNRIKELHRELDDIKDAASVAALRGDQITVEMLRRIDTLLDELHALEGTAAPLPPRRAY